jgi:hypothetical protein
MFYRPPKDIYAYFKKKYPQIAKYEDLTIDDCIWLRALDQANNGDSNAREFYAERTEGRVKEVVSVGFDTEAIQMQINLNAELAPEPQTSTNHTDTDIGESNGNG